ncbi:putative membrane-bound metal-dependent hydrolase (DUF457) [Candidatus Nitrososphaera evergladensis SR1]|uniref:Putative membrane-bound metal-dependent hydrolase (DUF457) n=1 Tax=Candidatus Nitrososphaera evergladensis SR1 TaxID=1459636 RepID=A0A075MM64_9ARCH|nr:putative membrane-bound metal-dependent hydrolase (DUF457) [Candidatus Nitrososphaera evergladensis SR1]
MVAFLIAYAVSRMLVTSEDKRRRLAGTTKIALALVMLLGILPDTDIVFQAFGIIPHKTFTHSVILSAFLVAPAIFVVARWPLKQTLAASLAYALAYAQHLFDDIIVGTLNVAYPFGTIPVGIGIAYGSVYHLALEIVLVAAVAAIVMKGSFGKTRKQSESFGQRSNNYYSLYRLHLFGFGKVDKVCYALLMLSLLVSFAYLLQEMKSIPRLFIESDLEVALFVILHLSALALVSFMILVSRENAKPEPSSREETVRDV